MIWIVVIVCALAIGVVVTLVAGRAGALDAPASARRDVVVPVGRPLGAADLRAVRFTWAWRGYSRDEVDSLLDRLSREAEERDRGVDVRPADEIVPPASADGSDGDPPDGPDGGPATESIPAVDRFRDE